MIPAGLLIQGVSKLGVLRPGAIGDVIVILPAIASLRKAFPEADITLLGRSWCKGLLGDGRTAVNCFMDVPPIPGINDEEGDDDPANAEIFLRSLQDASFDLLVNLQGRGVKANPLINVAGARITASFHVHDTVQADLSIPYHPSQHETLRAMELAKKAGGRAVSYAPRLDVLQRDIQQACNILPLITQGPYVVIHPFSSDLRRNWPLQHYGPVIRHLTSQGYRILLTGSRQQWAHVQQLADADACVHNTAGLLPLHVLSAVLQRAALTISPDTGPLHLARAVGGKTIGMYWAPHFANWGPLEREGHATLISWEMECPLCGIIPNQPHPFEPSDRCAHNVSFIRNISPEQVVTEAEHLLRATLPQNF